MRCPSALADEPERLRALDEYGLSSDVPLPSLDPVVQIAVSAFDVPAAAVNMIGRDEVFFAASAGIGDCNMSREVSFCAHAITQDDVLVVEDARLDVRFHDNPLVTGPEQIRFYAGVPVRSYDGHALGALCLVDSRPHASFSNEDRARLKELAKLVCDRLELQRLQKASESQSNFERVALTSPNGIVCFDKHGLITALNPAAQSMFGQSLTNALGQSLSLLIPAWRNSQIAELMAGGKSDDDPARAICEDVIGRRKDGSSFSVEIAWSSWTDGEEAKFGLVVRDVTEQRRQEDVLSQAANLDSATGLPNQRLLLARLGEEMQGGGGTALLVLGLAGFQDLNDTLEAGVRDQVLRTLGSRLTYSSRSIDVLARTATDQFAIMLSGIGDPIRARDAADAALAALTRTVVIEGQEIRVNAHCGIALHPSHAATAEELIANASLALQAARRDGVAQTFLFVPALRMHAIARRLFDAELHRAVERDELELFYQPQVRLADGTLSGAEALLRWNHPERGVLSPAAFLPALESSGLATVVGNWVIDQACQRAQQWRSHLAPDFRMGINLFADQFRTGNLRSFVRSAMERYQLPAGSLELEITETTVLDDEGLFLPLLEGLREDGVDLAFDDFGTGFASLSLVARYPLTHLKIDKSFVQRAFASNKDRAIVEAITDLAHRLDLKVIAEGVESRRYLNFCKEIGCDEAQGYLLGRPLPATEFHGGLKSFKTTIAH